MSTGRDAASSGGSPAGSGPSGAPTRSGLPSTSGLPAAERQVLDRIDLERIVDLTARLIAAGGENPGGTEAAAVAVLEAEAQRLGFDVVVHPVAPGRPNILVTLLPPNGTASGAPGLMFLGHSDVVPAGPGWSRDPFAPIVDAGRLYGRGSTDMKGGLAAVIGAMGALKQSGSALAGPVTLVCTMDEEDLGLGVRALVESSLPHSYLGCVVAEPTDMETVIACRGDSYMEIDITGRSAHSGRPADGRNAIIAAARICELIQADHDLLQQHPDPLLGSGTWNVGTVEGGQGTSVVAASCHLSVDRRLMPDDDAAGILDSLRRDIGRAGIDTDGISISAELTMAMPGFRTPQDHPLVTSAVSSVVSAGGTTRISGWTAACDGGFVSRDFGLPALVLGPGGINDQAHQIDESVGLDELLTAARAYALLCLRTL